jgi:hypothetical protein
MTLMLVRSSNTSPSFGQPRSRRYRRHQHSAERAFAAARLVLGMPVQPKTQAEAAKLFASCPLYVAAATALLEVGAYALIEQVLQGKVSLIEAAATVRKRARLVKAYREADRDDRRALGKLVGIDNIFDDSIAPLL